MPSLVKKNDDIIPSPDIEEIEKTDEYKAAKQSSRSRVMVWTFGAIILCGTCLIILLTMPNSPIKEMALGILSWLGTIPPVTGAVLLSLSYGVGLVLMLPGTPFNLSAGFLFGVGLGFCSSFSGALLGSVAAFYWGRLVGREWAETSLASRFRLDAFDKALEAHSFELVLLTRLSPVLPFPILNYLYGALTKINYFTYFVATALGLFPATLVYTWIGSELRTLADIWQDNGSTTQQMIWIGIVLVTTILVMIVVTLITKKILNNALQDPPNSSIHQSS
eukprot:TRINITY_DN2966_c0_g5_i1.p1 TRINITY_DN2966_c0_g5~~TRINITY_DN2966_c0_g5_i1.p1  ORF type:complete len:278 (-),score=58.31 TRINITY_DN2966_c0_g5_i1:192-1025(-)